MAEKTYLAIDLKSFYASVECMELGRDPLATNLVVADLSRTEKTICLAVSPSLKEYGISGRARLFEVVQRVKEVNRQRLRAAPGHRFTGRSSHDPDVRADPSLELGYEVARPQMRKYMEISSRIFSIYLKYVAPEDIHPYSIDEVFIDATPYLHRFESAHDMARTLIRDVLKTTGITATAGIGPNLYLCKVAMDITAKHVPADADGVRIAQLTEREYREKLWGYRPISRFWRVGPAIARRLEKYGLHTMGDVARFSLTNEDDLYREFGINAELLIDHAWGWEPATIGDIKAYRPENNSLSAGQVLQQPYDFPHARLVVHEMADALSLDLVEKGLVCDQVVLTVGYDIASTPGYGGEIIEDRYGRKTPKQAHGSHNLGRFTASTRLITQGILEIFDRTVDPALLVRRMYVVANHVLPESEAREDHSAQQLDLFTDYAAQAARQEEEAQALEKEKKVQQAMVDIKKKFGKNAILKGMNYEDGATARERNDTVGGHKA